MSDAGMATFKMGDDSCGINRLDLQKTSCQVFFNNVLHDITTLFRIYVPSIVPGQVINTSCLLTYILHSIIGF